MQNMALFALRLRPALSSSVFLRTISTVKPKAAAYSSAVRLRFYSPAFLSHLQTPSSPAVSRYCPVRCRTSGSGYSPLNDPSPNWSNRPPKETILLDGCDYEHWLVVLEFPKDPKPSEEEMVNTYVKTLATVLGSEEEAKKKIYALSTTTYTGFQCNIDEETSNKLKGLPGVLWVLPDSYLDVPNKDYGGDLFVDGKVIPRPQFRYSERQQGRNDRPRPRYDRRRDSMQIERREPTPMARREPMQMDRRDNFQGDRRDSFQGERRDTFQGERRDAFQGERREPTPMTRSEPMQMDRRDSFQGDRRDGFQGERRDAFQGERRDTAQVQGGGQ